MKLTAVLLVAFCAACGGANEDSGPPPTVDPSEERPDLIDPAAVGYVLEDGQVLWVEDPVGRLVGGECDELVSDIDEFYDRYEDIPGFDGLVCLG